MEIFSYQHKTILDLVHTYTIFRVNDKVMYKFGAILM